AYVEEEAHGASERVGTLRREVNAAFAVDASRSFMSLSRDIERYADLFAARTKVMKSSAMRDLMAVTARPEVISLAGGQPDTSTFPPESFAAQMTRIAQESSAQALQYGPTEGFERTKVGIRAVMEAED